MYKYIGAVLTHHFQTVDEGTAAVDHGQLVQHLTPVPARQTLDRDSK